MCRFPYHCVSLAVMLAGCLSRYAPPPLPSLAEGPLTLQSTGLSSPVEIRLDSRGVPHVFGATELEVARGLGFMHGRDRLFQVLMLRHAALGRLTEMFGEDLLPVDRRVRLVSWGVDQQLSALAPRDRAILDAYVAGLNLGASHAGRSAEMALLGLEVPTFEARDCLAILRLQAFQLAVNHQDELIRFRLLALLPATDPRRALLDLPVDPRGVSIVPSGSVAGGAVASATPASLARAPAQLSWSPPLSAQAQAVVDQLGLDHPGASNSWAVDARHTASGHAVLCNDPHLSHGAPSVFYLAHLETPDFTVAGATFPGAPMVLIGFTRHLAWGMTTSYADAQDLLVPGPDSRFEVVTQTYRLGKRADARVFTEQWQIAPEGPVLPPGYPGVLPGSPLIFTWGANLLGPNAHLVSGFFDLAAARDAAQVTTAVDQLRAAGQNMALAFTDGTIAYRLLTYSPVRPEGVSGRLPHQGPAASQWLSATERPGLTNPPRGFLVAANQGVIALDDPRAGSVGVVGEIPNRARRITERLQGLLAAGKPTVEQLLAVQQDTVSVEARDYAPVLARLCPAERFAALCDGVRRFDGDFNVDSTTALPYALLLQAVRQEVARSLGVPEALVKPVAGSLVGRNAIDTAVHSERPQVLLTPEVMARAADTAASALGDGERWGARHTLQFKGALATAPLVGGFFKTDRFEQAGGETTVRAEGGLPIEHGAALRMVVELADPPVGRISIDTGQSGHPRQPHSFDQFPQWNQGQPALLPTARADVEADTRARIVLTP